MKALKTRMLVAFLVLLGLSGCTLSPLDVPPTDGPPGSNGSDGSLEAKLDIHCPGCTPERKSGKAPLFAVLAGTKSKGNIVGYAITIFDENDNVLYGPVSEVVVEYTFETPGKYRVLLEITDPEGDKATASDWLLVDGPDEPSIAWKEGKYVDIGLRAPSMAELGKGFSVTVSLRVHSPMEFVYLNVFGFNGIKLDSRLETIINQPEERIYEFTVTGTAEREGRGQLVVEVEGGPPGANDQHSIEWIVDVKK